MTSGTLGQYGPVWASLALATLLIGCLGAPARAATETRTTPAFHAIATRGSWDVEVIVGKEQSVVIEGDKAVIAHVKSEVVDGELRIDLDRGSWSMFDHFDTDHLKARITVPVLTAFALQGSGNADIGGFNGGSVEFSLDGSGNLSADGNVDTLAVAVNGSGDADLSSLVVGKVSATVNGSGDATVHPTRSLAAAVNGSGDVTYIGDDIKVTSIVRGSGTIEKQ
jgi:hypothetical protein